MSLVFRNYKHYFPQNSGEFIMVTDPVTTTAAAKGTLTSVGSSIGNVFTSSGAFLASHPAATGFLLGLGAYYAVSKALKKRKATKEAQSQSSQEAMTAEAVAA